MIATIFKLNFVFRFLICLCYLSIISLQTKSAIHTDYNNSPIIGQYATIQEAHDAAKNGDAIYLYPSIPSNYYLDVPFVGTQNEGINMTIKVKSNN